MQLSMMFILFLILVSNLLTFSLANISDIPNIQRAEDEFYYGTFPKDFIWGAASASYQIEGGWNEDGKGMNIWDTFTRNPENIEDGSNGDVACDSYHKYEEDVEILKALKVGYYRLSLSWARMLPNGTTDQVNQAGVQYYKRIIKRLRENNIEPTLTLYHWDLPQVLEDVGGWLNESIVNYFGNYSRFCFKEFGDDVKWWFTLNEPWVIAYLGYGVGVKAPGKVGPGTFTYQAGHNLIKAHARAYHVYDDEFRQTQKGKISIVLNTHWSEPKNKSNPDDVAASERSLQMDLGWYANPIFVNGDYPEIMKSQVAYKSMQQNFTKSRLPEFTEEEKRYINGTHDFFGLNFYTAILVETYETPADAGPDFSLDKDIVPDIDPSWPPTGAIWYVTPFAMRSVLNWINTHYNNPPVYITENGVADRNGSLNDQHRIFYLKNYINQMLKAIDLDGCNVKGYYVWSLMDNFEWEQGYLERFGIYHVNFTDPARPRTAKESARYYTKLIEDNGFPRPNTTLKTF